MPKILKRGEKNHLRLPERPLVEMMISTDEMLEELSKRSFSEEFNQSGLSRRTNLTNHSQFSKKTEKKSANSSQLNMKEEVH